jgi:hypothetical protein
MDARIMAVEYFVSLDSAELNLISYGVRVKFCHLYISLKLPIYREGLRIILQGHLCVFNPQMIRIREEILPFNPFLQVGSMSSIGTGISKTFLVRTTTDYVVSTYYHHTRPPLLSMNDQARASVQAVH